MIGKESKTALVNHWKITGNKITLLPTTYNTKDSGIRLEKSIY